MVVGAHKSLLRKIPAAYSQMFRMCTSVTDVTTLKEQSSLLGAGQGGAG